MSFVLRREATLTAPIESAPGSPKLWGPGNVSSAQKPVFAIQPAPPTKSASPTKPEPARTKEDLYKLYESIQGTPAQDLSLKDIVERANRPNPKGPLQMLRERDGQEGRGWNQRQHHHRHELPRAKPKVIVPPKANGDQIHGHRNRSSTKAFGEFLEEHRKSNAANSFHEATRRSPEASPRRKSVSSSRMPPASPTRSPRGGSFNPPSGNQLPQFGAPPSPLRSPARSPLASPQRRGSPLASASYPAARLGGGTGRGMFDHVSGAPLASLPIQPRYSSKEGYSEGYKFEPAEMFKTKTTAAPPFQRVQPSNHCSTCSSYTLFKTRCLVCGNIYCRNCVKDAMGDMPEGRKCMKTCVGRPIHRKYRREAGKGCFCLVSKPATEAELEWARRRSPSNSVRNATPRSSTASVPRSSAASATNLLPMRSRSAHGHMTPPRISVS